MVREREEEEKSLILVYGLITGHESWPGPIEFPESNARGGEYKSELSSLSSLSLIFPIL